MIIRTLHPDEINTALELVMSVFIEYEAANYPEGGIQSFDHAIHDPNYLETLKFYGAFDDKKLIGVLATRCNGSHIALFFVDGHYHKQGIGRKLFEKAIVDSTTEQITVNSSAYAVEVYHHLGFKDTAPAQMSDGIQFTPMCYTVHTSSID